MVAYVSSKAKVRQRWTSGSDVTRRSPARAFPVRHAIWTPMKRTGVPTGDILLMNKIDTTDRAITAYFTNACWMRPPFNYKWMDVWMCMGITRSNCQVVTATSNKVGVDFWPFSLKLAVEFWEIFHGTRPMYNFLLFSTLEFIVVLCIINSKLFKTHFQLSWPHLNTIL